MNANLLFLVSAFLAVPAVAAAPLLDAAAAERFANLALACVHKEYPNKIAHVLNGDADVKPPRELTPAFYGCFDWHSAVHGHWLLARLARLYPEAPFAAKARAALEESPHPPAPSPGPPRPPSPGEGETCNKMLLQRRIGTSGTT